MGMLSLVMASLFVIYQIGTSAWQQVGVRADLAGQMHLVSTTLATACDQSPPEGVTISPDGRAVAVCSALTDDGVLALNTESGTLTWQRWIVIWFDPAQREIRRGELPMPAPQPQVSPIQNTLPDWPDDLPTSFTVSAREVDSFQVQWAGSDPPILELNMVGSKRRYGRVDNEVVTTRTSFRVGRP